MSINYALILSAGFGTRMKEIGENLPKPLWPLYEKTLLDVQISRAKEIGVKKIFINTHHLADQIHSYIEENYDDVIIHHEPDLLDIGGAVHRLAREQGYQGKLLILNSDVLLLNELVQYELALSKLTTDADAACLFTISVNANSGYNKLDLKDGNLKGIIKFDSTFTQDYETYTGISLINLEALGPSEGASKFFDTVADFKGKNVHTVNIETSEYYDFGTVPEYYETCFEVHLKFADHDLKLAEFLKNNKLIDEQKWTASSYDTQVKKVLNFSGQSINEISEGSIVLATPNGDVDKRGIYWKDLFILVD